MASKGLKKDYTKKAYEAHKRQTRERQHKLSAKGRDIAPLPLIVNPDRKEKCRESLELFAKTYFPKVFYLPFSPDHLLVISKIEKSIRSGGLYAVSQPRGYGKTSICETAALWVLLYGIKHFVAVIAAEDSLATQILESMKSELQDNDLLLQDFPEVTYPISCLEGISNRCSGQTYNGVPTRMRWRDDQIILPTIEGSPASGGIARVAGITGQIRGLKAKAATGEAYRPDFILVDDPTHEAISKSLSQTEER